MDEEDTSYSYFHRQGVKVDEEDEFWGIILIEFSNFRRIRKWEQQASQGIIINLFFFCIRFYTFDNDNDEYSFFNFNFN